MFNFFGVIIMPVYSYKCNTCGKTFDYKQSIKAESLDKCPESVCESEIKGQGEVHRVISKNIGLVFNGSGFYITDYAHGKSSPAKSTVKSSNDKSKECSGPSCACAG